MNYPEISVLFITYKRIGLLKRTYKSFLNNTDYPREKLELILCDDGSSNKIQDNMKKLIFNKYLFSDKNDGMGSNVNKGILAASGKYILQLQDDWICRGPKNYLLLGVLALEENPDIGIIRYRLGINYPKISMRKLNDNINSINILEWDQGDESIARFIYSDNPHLKRASLHKQIGLYKPSKKIYITELDFCKRFNEKKIYKVGYLKNFEEVFEHIGDSFSLRKKGLNYRSKNFLANNTLTKKIYLILKNILNSHNIIS